MSVLFAVMAPDGDLRRARAMSREQLAEAAAGAHRL